VLRGRRWRSHERTDPTYSLWLLRPRRQRPGRRRAAEERDELASLHSRLQHQARGPSGGGAVLQLANDALGDIAHGINRADHLLLADNCIVEHSAQDWKRAIADYTAAIKIDPDHARSYLLRLELYRGQGDYALAIGDVTQLIRLDPNDPELYRDRGLLWRNQGDPERAIADLAQALKLNPKFDGAAAILGRLLWDRSAIGRSPFTTLRLRLAAAPAECSPIAAFCISRTARSRKR
jgi:tetratricopeptide (TPR) repeat protein